MPNSNETHPRTGEQISSLARLASLPELPSWQPEAQGERLVSDEARAGAVALRLFLTQGISERGSENRSYPDAGLTFWAAAQQLAEAHPQDPEQD
jgi:hypothetical protein